MSCCRPEIGSAPKWTVCGKGNQRRKPTHGAGCPDIVVLFGKVAHVVVKAGAHLRLRE